MANLSSIARPYALASFEFAHQNKQLASWKAFLESASCIAEQPAINKLLNDPALSSEKLYDIFHDVLESQLNQEQNNLLLLITQNKRLAILPEISEFFNGLLAALEKIANVEVVTAITAEDSFKEKLRQALSKRMNKEVTLHCKVDPSIIGGAIIYIGDRVIDGSIRGKLNRMAESLSS